MHELVCLTVPRLPIIHLCSHQDLSTIGKPNQSQIDRLLMNVITGAVKQITFMIIQILTDMLTSFDFGS